MYKLIWHINKSMFVCFYLYQCELKYEIVLQSLLLLTWSISASGLVPFYCTAVTLRPKVPDRLIKVTVNENASSQPTPLNCGDTVVKVSLCSADGSTSQVWWEMRKWLAITAQAVSVVIHVPFVCIMLKKKSQWNVKFNFQSSFCLLNSIVLQFRAPCCWCQDVKWEKFQVAWLV